ncbi:MAG TPA: hypothetical protein VE404_10145 [Verrucomicrobiae bacterium]|nr:hypothetical protein [Verrucomicrobiae bacterium]
MSRQVERTEGSSAKGSTAGSDAPGYPETAGSILAASMNESAGSEIDI